MLLDDGGFHGRLRRVHRELVEHSHEAAALRALDSVGPGVALRRSRMIEQDEYVHVAFPDPLAQEIFDYADLPGKRALTAMEPANRLFQFRDRNLLHWP